MKILCVAAVLLAAIVTVNAATAGGSVLAPTPELESFLESGAHTEAEIDAMAKAELAALESSTDEHEQGAEVDTEAQAEAEAEVEMPRDTKQQEALEKRRARRAAAATAAAKPPVPPPKPTDPVRETLKGVPGGSDLIRMVYDELTRLGNVAATPAAVVTGAPGASPLGIADPRIRTLESRLNEFERVRTESAQKQKDATIGAITARLAGLDKTLAELKKSSAAQQQLTDRLFKAAKAAQKKEDAGTPVDYSVSYEKATLPADFEAQVAAILKSVKTEARKIYEKRCATCKRTAKKKAAAPKSYPSEGKPEAVAPGSAAAPTPAAAKQKAAGAAGAADADVADAAEAGPSMASLAPRAAAAAGGAGAAGPKNTATLPSGKAKKILFKPIINGKEPTPEGLRLSKALNDISIALPVTPAYALSSKEKALHDVLGESAVNDKWKTPRL